MKDQQTAPLVTVIMPAYNAEAYIEVAIRSVLSQTMEDFELYVIDDCSTDRSFQIAERYAKRDSRICVLRNVQNCGVARTRNRGIDLARGTFIALLDSDDVWHPEKLEKQLDRMNQTGVAIGYCSYRIIDRNGEKCKADYLVSERVTRKMLLKENCIQCSAMLIRADVLKRIKFNTEFYHEDYVLGLDILGEGHQAAGCREVLLDWRYIQNSRSFDKKKSAKNRWRIYRDYLKLPLWKAAYYFAGYAMAGFKKYFGSASWDRGGVK